MARSFARIELDDAQRDVAAILVGHGRADRRALDRLRWNLPRFRGQSDAVIAQATLSVDDAQLVAARHHHLDSWHDLATYVSAMENEPSMLRFELAVDAVVHGDVDALQHVMAAHPDIVHQRSTRSHRSTLLHYVSANGVEDYRQITPPNVLAVTRLLLDAGAEVDATSDAYGGGSTTLGLASTSAPPRASGAQIALIDLLLACGAQIDGDDVLPRLVRGALANGCPEAAYALASRGVRAMTLYAAAGCGNVPRVLLLVDGASPRERECALIVAAQQGHREIVELLLDRGVDVNASDDMSPLHQASAGGHLDVMSLLVTRGATLEQLNAFGGTVLSGTLWFAQHVLDTEFVTRDYPRVVGWLVANGARTDSYPELVREMAAVNARARRLLFT